MHTTWIILVCKKRIVNMCYKLKDAHSIQICKKVRARIFDILKQL